MYCTPLHIFYFIIIGQTESLICPGDQPGVSHKIDSYSNKSCNLTKNCPTEGDSIVSTGKLFQSFIVLEKKVNLVLTGVVVK